MRATFFFLVWAGLALVAAPNLEAQGLAEITRKIDAKRMRASSGLFDPESNRDSRRVAPGETITFAELEGAG